LKNSQFTKAKIIRWLKEEGFEAKELKGKHTYFNLITKMGGDPYNIFQSRNKKDSVIVSCKLRLTSEQKSLFAKMDKSDRRSFIWDLKMALLTRSSVGDFRILPKAPLSMEAVFISSKPLYYDGLTKTALFSTLFDIHKNAMMVQWMLEETSGATVPTKDVQSMYA
jgi:hypothetical protein